MQKSILIFMFSKVLLPIISKGKLFKVRAIRG